MYKRIACNALVASATLAAGNVNAQTSDSRHERQIELEPVVVTATRQETNAADVAGTVNVISRKRMDAWQVNSTEDLVRYEPGLTIKRNTSGTDPFGNLGSFQIRGVGANRVQIRVDGARVQEQIQDGNRNFVDLSTLKSVEIMHGPASVLWGADALGGLVMYRTLDPEDLLNGTSNPYAGQAGLGYDSFNSSWRESAALGFQLAPTLQGLVMYNHDQGHEGKLRRARADGGVWGCPRGIDAIRCNELNPMDVATHSALGKLVWRPNGDHRLKLTGEVFDSIARIKQMYDYGRQPNGSFNGDYNRRQKQHRYRIGLEHTWRIRSPVIEQLRWQLQYSPQQRAVTSDRLQRSAAHVDTSRHDLLTYQEDFLQLDLQLTSLASFWGADHRFSYGFQGDRTVTDYERATVTYNHLTGVRTSSRAGGFNFANARTTRADLYLQDEISLMRDRLLLTPGVRWANYAIDPRPDSDYVVAPGKEPREQSRSKFVPQIGALFKLDDVHSVYARYAEGFKMPTAQQLYTSLPGVGLTLTPNPELKPESVRSYEVGLRGNFDGSALFEHASYSIGAFKSDYKDFIQNFYNIPGTDEYTYRNLSRVNIKGMEASGRIQFNKSWAMTSSLAWQHGDSRYDADSRKQAYDAVVPLRAAVGVQWRNPQWGLDLELLGTFAQGVKRASTPGLFKPPGYAVYDAYLNWSPAGQDSGNGRSVTFQVGVENIADRRYFVAPLAGYALRPSSSVAATNPLELQTAPGRTAKLSTKIRF